jgi:hypothetical protein
MCMVGHCNILLTEFTFTEKIVLSASPNISPQDRNKYSFWNVVLFEICTVNKNQKPNDHK